MSELYQTEKVPMTESDRDRMNGEHVKCQLELETLKGEKRDSSSMYRVKIRELEEKIHTLCSQLDEGSFDRRYEVLEEPDDARMMIVVKRKDTGEFVTARTMTEVEKAAAHKRKQQALFPDGEEGDTEPPPAKLRGFRGGKSKARSTRSTKSKNHHP